MISTFTTHSSLQLHFPFPELITMNNLLCIIHISFQFIQMPTQRLFSSTHGAILYALLCKLLCSLDMSWRLYISVTETHCILFNNCIILGYIIIYLSISLLMDINVVSKFLLLQTMLN